MKELYRPGGLFLDGLTPPPDICPGPDFYCAINPDGSYINVAVQANGKEVPFSSVPKKFENIFKKDENGNFYISEWVSPAVKIEDWQEFYGLIEGSKSEPTATATATPLESSTPIPAFTPVSTPNPNSFIDSQGSGGDKKDIFPTNVIKADNLVGPLFGGAILVFVAVNFISGRMKVRRENQIAEEKSESKPPTSKILYPVPNDDNSNESQGSSITDQQTGESIVKTYKDGQEIKNVLKQEKDQKSSSNTGVSLGPSGRSRGPSQLNLDNIDHYRARAAGTSPVEYMRLTRIKAKMLQEVGKNGQHKDWAQHLEHQIKIKNGWANRILKWEIWQRRNEKKG